MASLVMLDIGENGEKVFQDFLGKYILFNLSFDDFIIKLRGRYGGVHLTVNLS